jgi:hypothetical protein
MDVQASVEVSADKDLALYVGSWSQRSVLRPQLLDCRAQILIFATEIVMYGLTLRIDQYGERHPLGS